VRGKNREVRTMNLSIPRCERQYYSGAIKPS